MPWPQTLLIVDDQEEVRQSLVSLLAEAGVSLSTVWHCSDVMTANRLFDEKKPDLTVVDIVLLGESGFDTVRHIRERDRDAAVVMMTAYPQFNFAMDAIRYHVNHFLVKPISRSQVEATLLDLSAHREDMDGANERRLCYHVLNRVLSGQEDLSGLETVRNRLGLDALRGENAFFAILEGTQREADRLQEECAAIGTALVWQHDENRLILHCSPNPGAGAEAVADALLQKIGKTEYRMGLTRLPEGTGLLEWYRRAVFALNYAVTRQVSGMPVCYEMLDLPRIIVSDSHEALMEALDRHDTEAYLEALRSMMAILRRCGVGEEVRESFNEMLSMEGLPALSGEGRSFAEEAGAYARSGELPEIPRAFKMEHVRRELLRHPEKQVNQEALCKLCGLSFGYLGNLFSQYTGRGLSDYHRMVRLRRAAELLRSTDYRVFEIAERTGFSGNKHFYSLFQKTYGLAPSPYHDVWRLNR